MELSGGSLPLQEATCIAKIVSKQLQASSEAPVSGAEVKILRLQAQTLKRTVLLSGAVGWLTLGGLRVSEFVAPRWTGLCSQELLEECGRAHLQTAGDDTCAELFKRICERVKIVSSDAVRDGSIRLDALQRWLENELDADLLRLECWENLREQLAFEIGLVDDLQLGVEERGCMDEDVDRADEEDEAKSLAEHVVYGWPSKAADSVTVRDVGRFVKAHPLDFPMGVGDLYDLDRPRNVRFSEWVQHLMPTGVRRRGEGFEVPGPDAEENNVVARSCRSVYSENCHGQA